MTVINARIANESDCYDLLLWRNDAQTRKSFFNSRSVSEKDHLNWFTSTLASKESKIIILEIHDAKIGMVRYDCKNSETFVSINTNPVIRGKGYSSRMLLESEKLIIFDNHIANNLFANILKINHISIRAFEKAGYQFKSSADIYYQYHKKLK